MKKHIVFDFDGTIADSSHFLIDMINQVARKRGFQQVKIEDINYLRTMTIKQRLDYMKIPLYKLPLLALDVKKGLGNSVKLMKPFPNMLRVLHTLKEEGYTLAVLSSNSKENIQSFLAFNDLSIFDEVQTTKGIFGKAKVLERYLKRHELRPEEVLYVGDEHRDILACQEIKVPIAAVTWGYDSLDLLVKGAPDYLVHQPEDLLALVQ
ncbi:HAD hydrolase-like protein [Ammoniphilus sp. CFH 90114]|uniref:HAD hydrolase-like protein n=1 Tax=Ammoniphilus sp. CFH 90114 TaxID=2493665 RepID=UPI00100E4306|nr:HAD hydrolase-like protein [Ammoniphilus sp. CFH 90114]RXT07174.1 HAD family hydrolase [Ammoniphilus sp. CFH 90114]